MSGLHVKLEFQHYSHLGTASAMLPCCCCAIMCHFMLFSPMQRDSTQKHVKNLDVVLGADTSVLILDDTEGVWPQHVANLIQVDRYIFFPACATRFGRSHKCLLEKGQDEDADKGMLLTALQVLQQVHTTLFQVSLA